MNIQRTTFSIAVGVALTVVTRVGAGIPTPRLHVEGNAIKDTAGNTVVLRGVSMILAGWPYAYGAGTSGANSTIKNFLKLTDTTGGWYPRVVRIPVADSLGSNYLFPLEGTTAQKDKWVADHLQPTIDSAKARGVYVILDYHLIEDVTPAKIDRCTRFWTYMAPKFADQEHVLFEVFNEPIKTPAGDVKWSSLKPTSQAWVNTIRSHAPKTIVLVSAPNWTSNLSGINSDTITGGNIVYVAHMYPQNDVAGIESAAKTVAAQHPVFFSEWGYDETGDATSHIPTFGDSAGYAAPFRAWATGKTSISWTAWCWSGSWGPPMWNSDAKPDDLNSFGRFTKAWLADTRQDNLPAGTYVPDTTKTDSTAQVPGDSVVFTTFDTPYGQNPRQTDLAVRLKSTRGGWWYSFHDDSGSTIVNGAGQDVGIDTAALTAAVSGGALHLKLTTSTSAMEYPYAALEANFTEAKSWFDLRKLTKLVLRLKGSVSGGSLRIYFTTRDVQVAGDWANYGISTDLTTGWSTVVIDASDLAPTPWSAAATSGWTWADSGAAHVDGIGFSVGSGADADLWIDNIALYGIDSSVFLSSGNVAVSRPSNQAGFASIRRIGDRVTVAYDLAKSGRVEARLVDFSGRLLASTSQDQAAGTRSLELPLASGRSAILMVRSGGQVTTRMLMPSR